MYLVGAEHPHKHDARRLLTSFVRENEPLVTDSEVLQEILHRYVALGRRDAITAAFAALLGLVETVFPIELPDVESARQILETTESISARDAIHVAVMRRHSVMRLMSFDAGFRCGRRDRADPLSYP